MPPGRAVLLVTQDGGSGLPGWSGPHRFDTGEVELAYVEGPASGPPLVMLHGGSGRWLHFWHVLPAVAERFHAFVPDLRGHGESGWTPGRYTVSDFVPDVAAFLDRVVGEPAILLGHSWGGIVAVATAATAHPLVAGLVVEDAPLSARTWGDAVAPDHLALRAWRALAGPDRTVEDVTRGLRDAPMASPGGGVVVRTAEVLGEDDPWYEFMAVSLRGHDPTFLDAVTEDRAHTAAGYNHELLRAIRCPVLLLQADPGEGGVLTDDDVDAAIRSIERTRHVRFDGAGHLLHVDRPEQVVAEVARFTSEIGLR